MKPLFPFYGSKWLVSRYYPKPLETVIEPFAGSAGYSLYWEPNKVFLLDIDPIIVAVWQYLIKVSSQEILSLPDLEQGQSIEDFVLPQEARWLIGFWLNRGSSQPKKRKTSYSNRTDVSQLTWSERARQRIAKNVPLIRNWTIKQGSYEEIQTNYPATYFIDPPYQVKGRYYRYNKIDYIKLAQWCKQISYPAIVCEQEGANWLPFTFFHSVKATIGRSREVIWQK